MKHYGLICILLLNSIGCSGFDPQFEVKDLRILAVQTEPAEILYSPLFLFPDEALPPGLLKPTTEIKVTVFAYDPRGNDIETRLQLCPAQLTDEEDGCLDYDYYEKKDEHPFPEVTRPVMDTLSTTETTSGKIEAFEYTFSIGPEDFYTFLPKDDLGNLFPSLFPTYLIFDVKVSPKDGPKEESERAYKRLPMYFDFANPATPPELAQGAADALGQRFCTPEDDIEAFVPGSNAVCIYSKTPNSNPDLLGFDIELSDVLPLELVTAESIDDVAYQLEETIDVKPGDKLLISPVVTAESVETYQVFSFDLNTGEIPAINREESLRVEYLITGGGFVDGPPFGSMQFSSNGHISTIWTLPNDRKKMDEDAIITVIRDQRGGTSVSEITVRYIEDGDPEASAFGF
jgi:hypothetical protein